MERYRDIIDDWYAFQQTIQRRQPVTVRANTLRADLDPLYDHLANLGFQLHRYDWAPDVWRVIGGPFPITKTLAHWLGFIYAQEAAACVPVLALQPQPGDNVLDLCAAPGGKTTQIAAAMTERGLLVANEPHGGRAQALRTNLARLGLVGTVVTGYDGRRLPPGLPVFDRVLVDAPCSGEGNLRRSGKAAKPVRPARARALAKLQTALLKRGLAQLKDGGTLVYATCTFAPEENEAVVDAVLQEADGAVSLEELPPGLPGTPGITEWQGAGFSPDVTRCRRIYPHHLDSGGMFVARFRRHAAPPWQDHVEAHHGGAWTGKQGKQGPSEQPRFDTTVREQFIDWWTDTFGVEPAIFDGLQIGVEADTINATNLTQLPAWPGVQSIGLPIARIGARRWQPTLPGLISFAHGASRNVIAVNDFADLKAVLSGGRLPAATTPAASVEAGSRIVVLRWHGAVIGSGTVDEQGLRHTLSQGRAEELLAAVIAHEQSGRHNSAALIPGMRTQPRNAD